MMRSLVLVAGAIALVFIGARSMHAETGGADQAAGAHLFRAANCVACHKWTGQGGGGYGGAAANLRLTKLDKDQIVETVRCGHPGGGGMPYFEKDAYANGTCFGIKASELDAKTMPAAAEHFLNPREIDAVAGYVAGHFKGKGDPTFEECRTFFETDTHLCDAYPHDAKQSTGDRTAPEAAAALQPHRGLKIEAAPDANSGTGKQ